MRHPDRRIILLALAGACLAGRAGAAEDALAAIETRSGGRLGVFALDTGSGRSLAHRADERVRMCSTVKLACVAALLARVDLGSEHLDRRILYGAADLERVGYAPDTRAHLVDGGMTLEALCAAAMRHSDNGAANLLFEVLEGPQAVTNFVRSIGDAVTRCDRTEPALNEFDGDMDTTTPRAFVGLARMLLVGDTLRPESRTRLNGWMETCTTGLHRIRAGVPAGWTAGDRTGTFRALANDVAILRPTGRAPILAAAYLDAPTLTDEQRDAALREVGAAVAVLTSA